MQFHGELATTVPDGSDVHDRAELRYSDKAGTPQPTQLFGGTSPAFVPPHIPISISSEAITLQHGQLITYTISFTNIKSTPLTAVRLEDNLPPMMQVVGCSTSPIIGFDGTCAPGESQQGSTARFFNGSITLGVGESRAVTVTARLKQDAADGALITNTAQLFAPVPIASMVVTNQVSLPNQPSVLLNDYGYSNGYGNVPFSYSQAYPNQPLRARIPYRNIGGAAAYDLRMTDMLPPGFVADTCDAGAGNLCAAQGGQIVYTITNPSPFPADASGVISLTMHPSINAAKGVTLSNTLLADYRDAAGQPYQAEATIQSYMVITPTTMTIGMDDHQSDIQPGQLVSYTIAVTNSGSLTTDTFYVADFLPPGLTYVSCSIEPGSKMGVGCGEAKGNELVPQPHISLSQNDEGSNIAPGQSMTMTVTARVDCAAIAGAMLTNRAVLYYNGSYAGVPAEDTDTVQANAAGCTRR